MASIKNMRLTIGGPESEPGTAVARTHAIPLRAMPSIDSKFEKAEDPAIIGRNMAAGSYLVSIDNGGAIPLTPRPCGGFGKILRSVMGTAETPVQVGGCIKIKYTGSEASAKITVSNSADTIVAEIGDLGDETGDATFGTSGVLDLTDTATDTLAELVSVIDGYTNYSAEKVFGADALDVSTPIDRVEQGKNNWVYIFFGDATSCIYAHQYEFDLTDTERPVYSVQKDGFQDNFLYDGFWFHRLSLTAALKGFLEGEVEGIGFHETIGQTASTVALEDVDPMSFANGVTSFGNNDYTYIRNISVSMENDPNTDGYGQGSYERLYHQKGETKLMADFQLRLDAASYAERAKIMAGDIIGLSAYFEGKALDENTNEFLLIEMPYLQIETFEFVENSPVIDAKISCKGIYPKGTVHGKPCLVTMLTTSSAIY